MELELGKTYLDKYGNPWVVVCYNIMKDAPYIAVRIGGIQPQVTFLHRNGSDYYSGPFLLKEFSFLVEEFKPRETE